MQEDIQAEVIVTVNGMDFTVQAVIVDDETYDIVIHNQTEGGTEKYCISNCVAYGMNKAIEYLRKED